MKFDLDLEDFEMPDLSGIEMVDLSEIEWPPLDLGDLADFEKLNLDELLGGFKL